MEPLSDSESDPKILSYISKTQSIVAQYIKNSESIDAETPIAYVYRDTDTLPRELAELYSYSEEKDFTLNMQAFQDLLVQFNLPPSWRLLSNQQKKDTILRLLDLLETVDAEARTEASRCILYIAQGCWAELHSASEQTECVRTNAILLHRLGTFDAFVDLLKIEVEKFHQRKEISEGDSEKLRVILAVLCTIVEILRDEKECGRRQYKNEIEEFRDELLIPFKGETLIITLLDVLVTFSDCGTNSSNFPLKKCLLLVWKLLLVALGGLDDLEEIKKKERIKNGLPPQHDPVNTDKHDLEIHFDKLNLKLEEILDPPRRKHIKIRKRPKVRKAEHDKFLDKVRVKFLGYSLRGDHTTTAGLPHCICDSIATIRKHIYIPLSEVQISKEKRVRSHPFCNRDVIKMTKTEALYQQMYPNLTEYTLALTKILLLVVPFDEKRTFECHPDIARIRPDSVTYSLVLNIDMFRHEEIILKAVSAIILLLLKHLKVNNVFQFEYVCDCLVVNSAIPILLNFFNQNISAYVKTLNEIPILDFPSCVIENQSTITIDSLNLTNVDSFSPRNMFLCINFLRILNKITKWKPTRIVQMAVDDAKTVLGIFRRVNNETFRLYVSKLLKMQMKYFDKSWKKNNSNVLTEIYLNVRLHLHDNFLKRSSMRKLKSNPMGNKYEIALKNNTEVFNRRRYQNLKKQRDVSTDKCTATVGSSKTLSKCFEDALKLWLKQEVLS